MIYSRQREAILAALKNCHTHPTADELFACLKPHYPNMSLGTVYRNLSQLAENGMVMKITMTDGADRYDGNADAHIHMACTHCGQLCDVPATVLNGLYERASANTGYVVSGCQILFDGVCNACLQAK